MRRALALLLAAACAQRPGAAGPPEDELWTEPGSEVPPRARVAAARVEELPRTLALGARVAFDDRRIAHLASPVAGRVVRVLAGPGDRVRRGAALAALVSPEAGSAVADELKARADLALAEAELVRQRKLSAVEAASRRDLEAAEDAHRKAEAELARARQRAALFRPGEGEAVSQELVLRSPIDGRVLARAASPGLEVAGAGAELFTIGDISRVWVLGDVPEASLGSVEVGQRVEVRVTAWPGRSFSGRVEWVASTLDPALRTGRLRVGIDNADGALKPEMFAQLAVDLGRQAALAVPRRALASVEGHAFVYVAAGDAPDGGRRFKRRRVRAGEASGDLVTVLEGLSAGEEVLVEEAPAYDAGPAVVQVTARQAERIGLRTELAEERPVGAAVAAAARIAFDDQRVARVASPVSGRVTRVLARPGQHVARGAPLATLASPEVGAALADAARARADLVAAEHERRRQQELFAAHAGARRDLEAAEDAWRKARAEAERAGQKAGLLAAGGGDAVTQAYTLRSPIDGEVIASGATVGLEVQGQWSGGGGPELFAVGALDRVWVLGEVYEMDLPRVRPGAAVEVTVPAWPGRTFQGTVDWVADVVDPATRTARVRCTVKNPGRLLLPEMAPALSIAVPRWQRLAVPRTALLRLGDDEVVFVAEPAPGGGPLAFRRRRVVAAGGDGLVPIVAGLAPGERVVTSGGVFLLGLLDPS